MKCSTERHVPVNSLVRLNRPYSAKSVTTTGEEELQESEHEIK